MRIGTVARATGVSERLLRYYEEQGLLNPARLPSGYRDYGEADVAAVRNIRSLLAAGLSVRVIADVLPCVCEYSERIVPTCPEFVLELRRERARIDDAMRELETSRRLIDVALDSTPDAVVEAADRGAGISDAKVRVASPSTPARRAGRHVGAAGIEPATARV